MDGLLPDDQRRAGTFTWPPPCENYVWEALQGAVVSAEMLTRAGYPAFLWEDRAILRAVQWLYDHDCPATGDDEWLPALVNAAYGTDFPGGDRPHGKGMGFTQWTHG